MAGGNNKARRQKAKKAVRRIVANIKMSELSCSLKPGALEHLRTLTQKG